MSDRTGIELGFTRVEPDPHPVGDAANRESWGDLILRVNGRLLTRFEMSGEVVNTVRWYAAPVASWLARNLPPIFHEERTPRRLDEIPSACAWFAQSGRPPPLTETEEERWFDDRQDWWARHALRAGANGAVLPNVFLRRVGPYLECSWDNERFAPPRKGMQFTDRAGVEYVPVEDAARAIDAFLRSLPTPPSPSNGDWLRWALPEHVLAALNADRGAADSLRAKLTHSTLPFLDSPSAALSALAEIPPQVSADTIRQIAKLVSGTTTTSSREALDRVRTPRAPAPVDPWVGGYEAALATRRALKLGATPIADMPTLLRRELNIATQFLDVEPQVDGGRVLRANSGAQVFMNRRSRLGAGPFGAARELGHLVMDLSRDGELGGVSSEWETWPISARAKAFAVMFLLPEDALRTRPELRDVDDQGLRRLAAEFHITPPTAAWHLRNLKIISESHREELMSAP